jgi:hypothetical protein
VKREVWRGIAMNLAAVVKDSPTLNLMASNIFHAISKDYTGYSRHETESVFQSEVRSAAKGMGPMRFDTMVAEQAPASVCTGGTALVHAVKKAIRIR